MAWGPPKSPKSGTKARAAYHEGRRGLGAAPYDHVGEEPPDDEDAEYDYEDPDEGSVFITPARTGAICEQVRLGVPIPVAAAAIGVKASLWSSWMRTAREHKGKYRKPGFGVDESPYVYFLDKVDQAKAQCESALLMSVHAAAKQDWKAAAWRLERLASKRHHLATKLDISAQAGGKDDIKKVPIAALLQMAKNEQPKALTSGATEEPVDAEIEGE